MPNKPIPSLQDTTASKYQIGQVWGYSTRPYETDSYLTVVKVELLYGNEVAVHIQIDDLDMEPFELGGPPRTTASHLPFSEAALDASVTELLDKVEVSPEYEEGYEIWREAFFEGNAGIFSITVAEVIDLIESTTSNQ